MNRAGSYLFEPAGSIRTLTVPDDVEGQTDVWFAIRGANLNLDDDDNVTSVIDAGLMADFYVGMCEELGLRPPERDRPVDPHLGYGSTVRAGRRTSTSAPGCHRMATPSR